MVMILLFTPKIVAVTFKKLFIYFRLHWVFVAVCGLPLIVASRGHSPGVVHCLLIAVAFLVVGHGL